MILPIRTLSDIINFHRILTGDDLKVSYVIDLTDYGKFVRPLFIASLSQFVMMKRSMGYAFTEIRIVGDRETPASIYFKGIGLEEQFHDNFQSNSRDLFNGYGSSLPVLLIKREEIPQKIEIIINFFRNQCGSKDYGIIRLYLSELLNNCYDHSGTTTEVVVYSQYYARNNIIKFAVCDTGKGIVTSVNDFHAENNKPLLDSEEAIEWALIDENTTKSTPRNRGRGLGILSSSINALDGEVWLVTNDRFLFISNKEGQLNKRFYPDGAFFGTAFEIGIKVSNLYDVEDGDLDYDL